MFDRTQAASVSRADMGAPPAAARAAKPASARREDCVSMISKLCKHKKCQKVL